MVSLLWYGVLSGLKPEMKSRRPTVARIGTRSLFKCYHSTRQHGRGYHVFELGLGADGPSAQTIGTQ